MNLSSSLDFKEMLRKKDVKITLGLLIVIFIGGSLFYGYKWYQNKIQRAAQKDFSEALEVFQQAIYLDNEKKDASKVKENIWDEVEIAFKTGYIKNKKSTLAPFFLAYEAQALVKLGKLEEAYNTLKDALSQFSKKSPYYNLYKIKLALMEFDRKNNDQGVAILDELIKNKNNIYVDMAAFYLGEYFWSINNLIKAKEEYTIAENYNPKSTWSSLAKMRLKKLV